jgi:hypothetical protein
MIGIFLGLSCVCLLGYLDLDYGLVLVLVGLAWLGFFFFVWIFCLTKQKHFPVFFCYRCFVGFEWMMDGVELSN